MAKKKFYVVLEGHQTGIFDNWPETEAQIKGFSGAKFKGFPSREQAEDALEFGWEDGKHSPNTSPADPAPATADYIAESISVDAACSGNPGVMEYQGVITGSGKQIIKSKIYPVGTNNIGEFLAVVHALRHLSALNDTKTPIYTDSISAIAWVRNKRVKTSLPHNADTEMLYKDINSAIDWLYDNDYQNQILKWDTRAHGESKADFGRK